MAIYYTRTLYFLNKEGFEAEFKEMLRVGKTTKEIREKYAMGYHVYRNILEAYGIRAQQPCRRKNNN